MATFLETILDDVAAAGPAVNALLREAELPELRDWFRGQPGEIRQANLPFAWFDWPPGTGGRFTQEQKNVADFSARVLLHLVLGGARPEQLVTLAAQYLPRIAARVEQCSASYYCWARDWSERPLTNAPPTVRLYQIEFEFLGQRAYREVA